MQMSVANAFKIVSVNISKISIYYNRKSTIIFFFKKIKKEKEGFYFLALLVYAYVPTATRARANTAAVMTAVADENSFIGVGSVTVVLLGTQMASMAAPLEVGVYTSELEV